LAKNGFDAQYGARPLKRLIQKEILDPMAENIINSDIKGGFSISVKEKNDKINFNIKMK
jgi:ATP-dependent Clp protease ATP-binding subunit ClpA